VNHKRIQRLWREEGLRRPVRTRKRRRTRTEDSERLRAVHPNQVWAIDFQFYSTHDGRQLKSLQIVDEHTREALAMRVGRSCTADEVVDVLGGLVARRGAPVHLRMDNGPEMIAWALRDYCRLAGTRTTYIEPGSPWENPFVEIPSTVLSMTDIRVLQQPGPRRALQRRGVRYPERSSGHR
jgi:putative transposase